MSITLTVDSTTVVLHPDLYWADENWSPVGQTGTRAITGALIVQAKQMLDGRPITLQPVDESSAWMAFSDLAQLREWAAVAGQLMVLSLRGHSYNVFWRHEEGSALEDKPVVHYSDVVDGDFYLVTLRLRVESVIS